MLGGLDKSVLLSYTNGMKTAISLPDPVFEAADALAMRLHVSRSELYTMALEKFLKERTETDVTQRINDFIDKHGQPVDPVFLRSTLADMRKVEW